jgi:hypothetical protein
VKRRLWIWAVLVLISVGAADAVARFTDHSPVDPQLGFSQPHYILATYLAAVDRGELEVCDQELSRSMIVPVRIEYVYDVETADIQVTVYSRLRRPIRVPDTEGCTVRAVGAVLSADGHIVETTIHVWRE